MEGGFSSGAVRVEMLEMRHWMNGNGASRQESVPICTCCVSLLFATLVCVDL